MGVSQYPPFLHTSYFQLLYLSQTAFRIDFLVCFNFKTTRRNQDLDMKLKVKLQKPTNKNKKKKTLWW